MIEFFRKITTAALSVFVFCIALYLGGSGCREVGDDLYPAGRTITEWVENDRLPAQTDALPPLDDLILYLDSSLSMKGYADPNASFEYSMALEAVRNVVTKLDPQHAILYRKVDTEVGDLSVEERTLSEAKRNSNFYTGNESNLGSAIREFERSHPMLEAGSGIARCHILVTDGVQHLEAGAVDSDCSTGNDPRCVYRAVKRLIDKGWGVHLFGIRSRFNGKIYSEIARRWLEPPYRATSKTDPSRYRPFLIYLFTNNAAFMDQFVKKFRRELRKSEIDEQLIAELPLTLPLVETSQLELRTGVYRLVDEFGSEIENPLFLHTEPTWREDYDGERLPDYVQTLEYSFGNIDFVEPFALHITATVDFTEAWEIAFSRREADVGSLLHPLSVVEVPRPDSWYRAPETDANPDPEQPPLEGTGVIADAPGDGSAGAAAPPDEETQVAEMPNWPPPGLTPKKLQFDQALLEKPPDPPFLPLVDSLDCSLPGGCHLIMRWSVHQGDFLPITMLRVDARLDPDQLDPPSWLRDWSTDDDSKQANSNKILNLDSLTRGLLDNKHIARQGLESTYLVIFPMKK